VRFFVAAHAILPFTKINIIVFGGVQIGGKFKN
jgi:hypothetical protein